MSSVRRAVIDVGTNSVKLLVADVTGHQVRPVLEDSKQTRLGQGFYETHRLQPDAIERTTRAAARFADICQSQKVQAIRVIATSAARDAINATDFIKAIGAATGLGVEIISGEKEADWVFQGVTSDPELAKHPLLLLDVGGGSTEFILGQGDHKHFRQSFPLGTVRLMETLPHSDPPTAAELATTRIWLAEFLKSRVRPSLVPFMQREPKYDPANGQILLVGTGGTTSILARMEAGMSDYDREQIEATRLSRARVKTHVNHLWSVPLAERKQIIGLPPKRADVILTGAAIYEALMEEFNLQELRVSTRGLRYAAVMNEQ